MSASRQGSRPDECRSRDLDEAPVDSRRAASERGRTRGTRRRSGIVRTGTLRIGAALLVLALPEVTGAQGGAPATDGRTRKVAPAPAAAGAPGSAGAPGPGAPLSPEEREELDKLDKTLRRFDKAAREHQARLKRIIRAEYERRVKETDARYADETKAAEKELRARHETAMRELERFLKKYPDDPKWTPDAMFRLAELYLDEAGFAYEKQQLALGAGNASAPESAEPDPDAPPSYSGPDYSKALELWRDLVRRFPDYRQIDGALYLLAYYLEQMMRTDEAKQVYLGLVCANKYDPLAPPRPRPDPDDPAARIARAAAATPTSLVSPYEDCQPRKAGSALVDEAWVRIGEAHFDTRGELPLAIAAYKKVATKKDSEFYDEALYKLAWSYYRNDQFIEGIDAFDELVVFSDRLESEGKSSVELRQEAIDYIAISFADPWEKNAQPDPKKSLERAHAYYRGREKEKHVRDVFEKLGDTLRAGEAYDEAIAAWRHTLDQWPLHPRNPIVHQKIVDALADKGDAAGSMAERARLAAAYKKGSTWYVANETNREAMDAAARLGEQSLIAAAKATHREAQLAYQEWEKKQTPVAKSQYLELYKKAASLYHQYLAEYPSSPEVYELTYRLADCYFFSEQYIESIPHYRWVRDHRELGTKYFEPAALSIVQATQAAVDQAKAQGKLVEPPIPTPESLARSQAPLEIAPLYRQLQQAYDEYMTIIRDPKTAPKMALASAMISYRHLQLDDALARFQVVMERYCQTPEATQAYSGIVVIYDARGDDKNSQATKDKFIGQKCGEDKDVELAKAQKLSKEYEIAAKLFKEGKYGEAAMAFYRLYREAPDQDENRDDSLFSAAVAFERAGKPKTAIAIYQEFVKRPEFKTSEYYVEALYRTAVSYQKAFDYDNAVDTYLRVVELAGEKGRKSRPEFDLVQARLDAMWDAAVLREQDRVYYDRGKNDPGAATLYKRYAAAETRDRKRASQAYFRAALVYEKAGDTSNMIKTFRDWKKAYGKDEGAGAFYVLSQYKIAKALEKARDRRGAADYYRATIRAFDESGEKPGSPSAELAAEAQFWLAEQFYRAEFEPYKVKWKGNLASRDEKKAEKAINDTLDALAKISKDAAAGYNAVARFEASWSLAATVRLGDISFFAGQKLFDAPVPREIVKLDQQYPDAGVMAAYQTKLEELVQPQTDAAKDFWLKAVAAAKKAGVSNEWSKLAQQRLNSYIAADLYPVQRDELVDREVNP